MRRQARMLKYRSLTKKSNGNPSLPLDPGALWVDRRGTQPV
jgi:hypothetical protein